MVDKKVFPYYRYRKVSVNVSNYEVITKFSYSFVKILELLLQWNLCSI